MTTSGNDGDWHIRLFRKSLLKQAKWQAIERMLPEMSGKIGLDIGADSGVISYLLRSGEGDWSSADAGEVAVASIQKLVGERVRLIENGLLPFDDDSFDCVVIIDMLEHVEDDEDFLKECHRVMKPAGRILINVPHLKRFSAIRVLRKLIGLSDEEHGHLRPGYTEKSLFKMVTDGFDVEESRTYSRFFVELMDTGIRFATKIMDHSADEYGEKGMIMDEELFKRMRKLFRFYSLLYPFFLIAAQLDKLLFFTRGHYLIVRARRRLWIPRTVPVLKDGRSITEAALNYKIGSANTF